MKFGLRHRVILYLFALGVVGAQATAPRAIGQSRNDTGTLALAPRQVDQTRARAAGIRKLSGRHIDLYTDVASDPEVDRLPQVFDQAVRQWAEYFGVSERRARNWRARGYLIEDRTRFDALDLMPPGDNDQFTNGISLGAELWLYDQPTPYYRRHLLLHEGTHVFMATLLGSCGPGWYMEGTAELMATHQLDETTGKLQLAIMPASRQQVPMLGRIKLIEDAREAGRVLTLPAVMQIDNRRQLGNESYAWCWAAAKFLDAHPRYGERFRRLRRHVRNPSFDNLFRAAYRDDWDDLNREWLAFVATLDHNYDFQRMAIDFEPGTALDGARPTRRISIAADRGWQSSGVWLEAGKTYQVTASGRFQIAQEEIDGEMQPWPCEPGGVTIEYHDGRPLGMLLGAVVAAGHGTARETSMPDTSEAGNRTSALAEPVAHAAARGSAVGSSGSAVRSDATIGAEPVASSFSHPLSIGLEQIFTPSESGTLYLRVNDSGGRLDDNRGKLNVVVEEIAE